MAVHSLWKGTEGVKVACWEEVHVAGRSALWWLPPVGVEIVVPVGYQDS